MKADIIIKMVGLCISAASIAINTVISIKDSKNKRLINEQDKQDIADLVVKKLSDNSLIEAK